METGSFCFLNDQYFLDFPDSKLMKNHEIVNGAVHQRPCFFAFSDVQEPSIYWLIPVSKQEVKYRLHAQKKIDKWGYCSNLVFGNVAGSPAAFLIQNMCPATQQYIQNIYVDKNNIPIKVDNQLANEVIKNAKKTLSDYFRGRPVIFPDVRAIKTSLLQQLALQQPAKAVVVQSVTERLAQAKAQCNGQAPRPPQPNKDKSR